LLGGRVLRFAETREADPVEQGAHVELQWVKRKLPIGFDNEICVRVEELEPDAR